jgi:hypothetical protein
MTGIGVQMRTKRMSNGGPTMRGRAKLTGRDILQTNKFHGGRYGSSERSSVKGL